MRPMGRTKDTQNGELSETFTEFVSSYGNNELYDLSNIGRQRKPGQDSAAKPANPPKR